MLTLTLAATAVGLLAAPTEDQTVVTQSANGEFISRHYPERARKAGEEGKVGFQITVEPDGSLGTCEVTQSSGHRALDDDTCELIIHYARLKPVRDAEGRAVRAVHTGYINWRLPAGTVKTAAQGSGKPRERDRIICKRETRTGSLVAKTRQCLTKGDWANQQRYWEDELDRIQGRGFVEGD